MKYLVFIVTPLLLIGILTGIVLLNSPGYIEESLEYKVDGIIEIPLSDSALRDTSGLIIENKELYREKLLEYLHEVLGVVDLDDIEIISVHRLRESPELGDAVIKIGEEHLLIRLNDTEPVAHAYLQKVLIKKNVTTNIIEEAEGIIEEVLEYEIYELTTRDGEILREQVPTYILVARLIKKWINLLGTESWRLVTGSTNYILNWAAVVYVTSESYLNVINGSYNSISPWGYGWICENFTSYSNIMYDGLFSHTQASGKFVYAPFGFRLLEIYVTAWVIVWFNGEISYG